MNVVEFRGCWPAVRSLETLCAVHGRSAGQRPQGTPLASRRLGTGSASLAWSVCSASGLRIVLRHLAGFVGAIEFVRHQILGGGWALPAPLSFPNLEARSVDLDIVPA